MRHSLSGHSLMHGCMYIFSVFCVCPLWIITINQAKIKWPLIEGYGKLTCTGLGACYNTNFPDKPNSTQALTITCGADNVCSESSIYCPKYAPCNVQCLGRLSCSNVCTYPHSVFAINDFDMITSKTNIVWPLIEGYGTLTCSGERACTNLEFPDKLISTEPLNIICNNSACPGTTIYCPEYAACNIQCISVGTQFANEYGCNGVCQSLYFMFIVFVYDN